MSQYQVGFPIRKSSDQRVLSPPRSLSQSATSFIASCRQGIHQTPFSRLIRSRRRGAALAHAHPAWLSGRSSFDPRPHGSRLRRRRRKPERIHLIGTQTDLPVSIFLDLERLSLASNRAARYVRKDPRITSGAGHGAPPLGTTPKTSRVFAL